MGKVRVGVIGLGNMGTSHANAIFNGHVKGAVLSAVCDSRFERLEWAGDTFGEKIQSFSSIDDFFNHAEVDGIIIATPHYRSSRNWPLWLLNKGFMFFVRSQRVCIPNKFVEMNEAAENTGKVFSMMYNQRTNPLYQKVKD